MHKIITTCGNIFMGVAHNKETLEWAQNDVFGKAKQTSTSITINDLKIFTSISEKLDYLVPAPKIADMAMGWLTGQAARDFTATDKKMLSSFDIEQSEDVMRCFGRIVFPVFAFLIAKGFAHTLSRTRYFLTLLGFDTISEVP